MIAGLTLDINIEQYEYIDLLSQEAGVRVFVASQNDMPFPYELGHSAPPGYATAIQLRKVLRSSLTSPKSLYHISVFMSIEVLKGYTDRITDDKKNAPKWPNRCINKWQTRSQLIYQRVC